MFTDAERISRLEQDVADLKNAVKASATLTISAIQATLDQMFDEQLITSATRIEIFRRISIEVGLLNAVSEDVARAARGAMPLRSNAIRHSPPPAPRVRKPLLRSKADRDEEA